MKENYKRINMKEFIKLIKNKFIFFMDSHPYRYNFAVSILNNPLLNFLLPHESDYYGFKTIVNNGYVMKTGLILDVGANKGHSARGFYKLFPKCKVISIEANYQLIKFLNNVKKKFKNYEFYIFMVSNYNRTKKKFYVPFYKDNSVSSAASPIKGEVINAIKKTYPGFYQKLLIKEIEVHSKKIDSLNLNPDFVKIDIQGFELEALKGMEKTIKKNNPIILVEISQDLNLIKQYLKNFGYDHFFYDDELEKFVKNNKHLSKRNIFFVPKNCNFL